MTKRKERVGDIAVRLGFATRDDIKLALKRQREIERTEGARRLLGLVMVEMGLLSTEQLIIVLQELKRGKSAHF